MTRPEELDPPTVRLGESVYKMGESDDAWTGLGASWRKERLQQLVTYQACWGMLRSSESNVLYLCLKIIT